MDDLPLNVFIQPNEASLRERVRDLIGRDPKKWRCPCKAPGCPVYVLYGRHAGGRVYFWGNFAHDTRNYGGHGIDNVEDFAAMLTCAQINEHDRILFSKLLEMGLKRALLNA